MKKVHKIYATTLLTTSLSLLFVMLQSEGHIEIAKQSSEPYAITARVIETDISMASSNRIGDNIQRGDIEREAAMAITEQIPEVQGVSPEPTERELITRYVIDICTQYNLKVKPEFILSVINTESEFKPTATNGNCVGLMQVSKYWHADRARKLGVTDFYDPYSNILLGVDYLVELLDKYKDPSLVLMLYNMNHDTAISLYHQGKISYYAKTIIANSESYK